LALSIRFVVDNEKSRVHFKIDQSFFNLLQTARRKICFVKHIT